MMPSRADFFFLSFVCVAHPSRVNLWCIRSSPHCWVAMYNSQTLFVRRLPISREMDDKGSQGTDLTFFRWKMWTTKLVGPWTQKKKKLPTTATKKKKDKFKRRENRNEKSTCHHHHHHHQTHWTWHRAKANWQTTNADDELISSKPKKKKKKKRASCLENVNFMPNKVNERATSIYIPSPWYSRKRKRQTFLLLLLSLVLFFIRIKRQNERKINARTHTHTQRTFFFYFPNKSKKKKKKKISWLKMELTRRTWLRCSCLCKQIGMPSQLFTLGKPFYKLLISSQPVHLFSCRVTTTSWAIYRSQTGRFA